MDDYLPQGYLQRGWEVGKGMEIFEAEDCAVILNRAFAYDLIDEETDRIFKVEFTENEGWTVYFSNPEQVWVNDSYYFPLISGVIAGVLVGKGLKEEDVWLRIIQLNEAMGVKPVIKRW